MNHLIIGTAGHVDHGKTTLIRALTGVDTDRLKEEKERGISIELGFAPFDLASGRRAGVVDVPGHERFIKNMLAGAGGIDLVLLVVAANESVMPQTLEHLHILNLLGIEQGIIVLTKTDLVEADWLELVQEDIRAAVKGTFLAAAPIILTSAVTGEGIKELKQAIDDLTLTAEGRDWHRNYRLPVDRVFTIKGSGTVVTGTLVAGMIRAGDTAEILPRQLPARVRQIQVHGNKVDAASAGQRVAVNLAGVELTEIERGNVLAAPGTLHPTQALDAKLQLLTVRFGGEPLRPLANRDRIRFYTGTQEILGRVVLLEAEEMQPGDTAFVQFFLEEAAVVGRGDKFIIRTYSPLTTIGGGTVIEPYAKKHRRFKAEVIDELEVKEKGAPEELVEQYLLKTTSLLLTAEELRPSLAGQEDNLAAALAILAAQAKLQALTLDNRQYYAHPEQWAGLQQKLKDTLGQFHRQQPLKLGLPQEELRGKLFSRFTPRVYAGLLEYLAGAGLLIAENQKVRLPEFTISFKPAEEAVKQRLIAACRENPYSPPSLPEFAAAAGVDMAVAERVAEALVELGLLVRVAADIIFLQEAVEAAKSKLEQHLKSAGSVTLAEFRDMLQTTRKYALLLLEYFDEFKFTRRLGDKRVLGKQSS